MKIVIPVEYRGRFGSERAWIKPKGGGECIVQEFTSVFVARWEGYGLLLMNGEERKRLVGSLDGANGSLRGFARFVKSGIIPVAMEGGVIRVPDYLAEWLGKGELIYTKDNAGVVVSTQVQK